MILRLIENHINNLSVDNIKIYANNNGIIINGEEAKLIYLTVKKNYKDLLYTDGEAIFFNIKSRINPTAYNKIYELYHLYKLKYKKYL